MALETATYINGLVPTNPAQGDLVSAGDDHLRLLKSTIRNTFPNITGAITASHTELNHMVGVTSGVQAQLNGKAANSHTHAETDIVDGNVFPRVFGTETIQGQWAFALLPTFNANPFFHTGSAIPETNIADGAVFPRLASNETITGNWNFGTAPLIGGLGALRWATAGLTSGRTYLQNGGGPPGSGTPGDLYLIY